MLSLLILAGGAAFVVYAWSYWTTSGVLGTDFRVLVDAGRRWVDSGQPYLPYQLAGPYNVYAETGGFLRTGAESPIMYPPQMMLLFAAFIWLPALLWWLVPVGITAWAVYQHHPRPLVWPVLALLVAFPQTLWFVATGNPLIWFVAALALATVRGWSGPLVLLKPTLGPFALIGIWRREWWVGAVVLAFVSLAFLPLWDDYLAVLSNTLGGNSPLFSLNQYPAMMLPVIAWLGSTRQAEHRVPARWTALRIMKQGLEVGGGRVFLRP